jgi:hypothetical protein
MKEIVYPNIESCKECHRLLFHDIYLLRNFKMDVLESSYETCKQTNHSDYSDGMK